MKYLQCTDLSPLTTFKRKLIKRFLINSVKLVSSIQFGGIETFCPLGHIWIWGYWNILSSKIRPITLSQLTKILNCIKSSYMFSVSNCSSIPNMYIIHKIIETFLSIYVTDLWILAHKGFISSKFMKNFKLYELNCFKYFLTYFVSKYLKIRHEIFWTSQVFMC